MENVLNLLKSKVFIYNKIIDEYKELAKTLKNTETILAMIEVEVRHRDEYLKAIEILEKHKD